MTRSPTGCARVLGVTRVDPQRPAVRRQLLDVEQRQAVGGEDALDRRRTRSTKSARGRSCRTGSPPSAAARCGNSIVITPCGFEQRSSCRRRSRSGPERAPARCCRAAGPAGRARARSSAALRVPKKRTSSECPSRSPPRRRWRPARRRAPGRPRPRSAAAGSRRCWRSRRPGLSIEPESEALRHRLGVVARVLDPARRVRREVGVLGEDLARARRTPASCTRKHAIAHVGVQRVERLHLVAAAQVRCASGTAATSRGRRRSYAGPRRRSGSEIPASSLMPGCSSCSDQAPTTPRPTPT